MANRVEEVPMGRFLLLGVFRVKSGGLKFFTWLLRKGAAQLKSQVTFE